MIGMSRLRRVMGCAIVALVLAAGSLAAQVKEPFTPERFSQLQQQNALILIDVYADWCPTCAQQQRILADFQARHGEVPLHILQVDFDTQKEYVTRFAAPRQSTLILYRGTERVWFSVAETRPQVVFDELTRAAAGATNR
jgi:thioredoxin 1